MTALASILLAVAIALTALAALFIAAMRAKWSPLMDLVRRMNLRYLNPPQMSPFGVKDAPRLYHADHD